MSKRFWFEFVRHGNAMWLMDGQKQLFCVGDFETYEQQKRVAHDLEELLNGLAEGVGTIDIMANVHPRAFTPGARIGEPRSADGLVF